MISSRWLEPRKAHWLRLQDLVSRCGRSGPAGLTHDELRELALLYRQTAADLSTLREDPSGSWFARHLNQLLCNAHNIIYHTAPRQRGGIVRFYRVSFPRVFRETSRYTMTACALFLAGALAGWVMTFANPGFPRFLLGGEMIDTIQRHEMWTHKILRMMPLAASGIMTNNLAVCFAAAAAGITAGLGTIAILLNNGLLLGVIGAACYQAGMSRSLWSFVAPHGALELPAIFIAGGAGLLIADALLFPGNLPRAASLVLGGRRAIQLILGTIPLLVVAGIIEGFISATALAVPAKFLLGSAGAILLGCYLALAGRAGARNHMA
ncbi:MAG: stage II sporulation protein M [Acidobacteriota bacterium]